jgi:hypothetical protein
MSLERLGDRRQLLTSMDRLKRETDATGIMGGMDSFTQRAFDVLTGSRLLDALDLSKEDPKVRAAYGDGKPYEYQFDGAPTRNEHLLMARRLVEAGVRVVSLSYGRWDSHSANFDLVRDHGGKLDQCLSALIDDLAVRGMLDDVTVAVWGEFGRTPKINAQAGRDHWPQVNSAVLIGGGLRTGQVIGATNRTGEHAVDRQDMPVHRRLGDAGGAAHRLRRRRFRGMAQHDGQRPRRAVAACRDLSGEPNRGAGSDRSARQRKAARRCFAPVAQPAKVLPLLRWSGRQDRRRRHTE